MTILLTPEHVHFHNYVADYSAELHLALRIVGSINLHIDDCLTGAHGLSG